MKNLCYIQIMGHSELKTASEYLRRGNDHSDARCFEEALRDYSEAINLGPKNATAYVNRGGAYFNIERLEQALQDYNEAIKLNPK